MYSLVHFSFNNWSPGSNKFHIVLTNTGIKGNILPLDMKVPDLYPMFCLDSQAQTYIHYTRQKVGLKLVAFFNKQFFFMYQSNCTKIKPFIHPLIFYKNVVIWFSKLRSLPRQITSFRYKIYELTFHPIWSFLRNKTLYIIKRKGRDLTQSYDKSPYTNINTKRAKVTTQTTPQKSSITQRSGIITLQLATCLYRIIIHCLLSPRNRVGGDIVTRPFVGGWVSEWVSACVRGSVTLYLVDTIATTVFV